MRKEAITKVVHERSSSCDRPSAYIGFTYTYRPGVYDLSSTSSLQEGDNEKGVDYPLISSLERNYIITALAESAAHSSVFLSLRV